MDAKTLTRFRKALLEEKQRILHALEASGWNRVKAAQALGMTYPTTMAYIVVPQAFRNMVPVLLTQTIILFQDTSLVYVISATDFLGAAAKIANRDYRLVEMYTFAAVVYFIISFSLSLLVKRLQSKIAVIR